MMKPKLSEVFKFMFVCAAVSIIYVIYVFTFGSKLTDANELYIKASNEYEDGDLEAAKSHINDSLEIWSTKESKLLKEKIESQLN